ncbi:MAG: LamG-like jellyroll fold domain-containing protein [Bacteroidota bacterium]
MKRLLLLIIPLISVQIGLSQTTIDCSQYQVWDSETQYQRQQAGEPVWVVYGNTLYYMADAKWNTSSTPPDETDDWTTLGNCGDDINWCDFGNEWDSEETYSRDPGGERIFVLSRGDLYEMAWGEYWSHNEPPYKEQYDNRWTFIRNCTDFEIPACGSHSLWEPDITYSKDDEVFYADLVYVCKKWWSKNKNPEDYPGDWDQIGTCQEQTDDGQCMFTMWEFDNLDEQFLTDTTGQYPAILHNAGSEAVEDAYGLDFDGDDMFLTIDAIADDFSSFLNEKGSLSFWCMLDGTNDSQYFFHAFQSQGNKEISLFFETGNQPQQNSLGFVFADWSRRLVWETQNMPVQINAGDSQWHHILVNWNRNSEKVSFWVDATLIAEEQILDNFNWDAEIEHITLGSKSPVFPGNNASPSEVYSGKMDKLRICSKNIGQEEIQNMYNVDMPTYEYSLPVQLLYFNPECGTYKGVNVEWSTASEQNNDYFTLFRSYDGENWDAIAEIPGAGTTNEVQNYKYNDVEPAVHDTYYRLMQTDFDGTSEVFDVLSIYCKYNHKEITIFPNPARDYIMLSFINEHHYEAPVMIEVYDASGRMRHKQEYFADPEYNEMRIDLPSDLNDGTYYMQAKLGEQDLYASPFVVQR